MVITTKNGKSFQVDDEDQHLLDGVTANVTSHGYVRLVRYHGTFDGKPKYSQKYLHRVVMGAGKGYQIDHINGDRTDNRKSNLRACSNLQNSYNKPKRHNNKSGYKGVHRVSSGKWCAQITADGRCRSLGVFELPETAALAYNKAARELHGEFAFQNEVE